MTAADHSYESPKARAGLAREAGLGRLSFPSILAGVLVAYGAFAVLAALAGTVAAAVGLNTDLNQNDWATLGLGSTIAVAVVLLVAVVGAVAASQTDTEAIGSNLGSLGIPTTGTEWGKAGTVAGIGSLAAMLVGALLGGVLGERWHSKLTRRAVSGKYRPNRDDQPANRDHDRPAHDQTLDQHARPTPDHQDNTGATRLTSPPTQEPTTEPVSRPRHDR
jgi:hypothetical protein